MEPRTDFVKPAPKSSFPIFQEFVCNNMASDFKLLQLNLFHTAVSKFSGPIAALRDRSIPTTDSIAPELQNNVMFFSQKGKLTRSVSFTVEPNNRCVLFAFTNQQILVVVQQNGNYHLIDPFRGSTKTMKLADVFSGERILAGRILQSNRLFLLSSSKKVFEIADIFQPIPKERIMLAPRAENPIIFLEISKGELDCTYLHENGDIYNWATNEYLFSTELAEFKKSTLVYLSKKVMHQQEDFDSVPEYWVFVYHRPFRVVLIRSVNRKNQVKVFQPQLPTADQMVPLSAGSSKKLWKQFTYHTGWIGSNCFLSNGLWTLAFNLKELKVVRQAPGCLCYQVDGIRIYGQNNIIIREVPEFYMDMFLDSPNPTVLQLFVEFSKYQQNEVVEREILQKYRGDAASIINSIMEAAEFAAQPLQQMRILKFGTFLKTYYCLQGNESKVTLKELCADLRFINNLKYQFGNRMLTVRQLRQLKEKDMERLVNILLRYNLHYLGDIVGGGQKIYLHWAKCKIEKAESEAAVVQQIVDKFQAYRKREKKRISFVDIARYSVQTNRFQLAQKLIEYEPNLQKKVTILLWMAIAKKDPLFTQKVLENAHLSHNSDIICKVLKELQKSPSLQETLYKVLQRKPILKQHYLKYLREMDPDKLKEYYFKTKSNTHIGYLALESYINKPNDDSLKIISNYLPATAEAISQKKANQYTKFLRQLRSNKGKVVDESEVDKFKDVQHPEFMAEILFNKGLIELGVKVIYRIKTDQAFKYLEQYDRWREAAVLAKERKHVTKLKQLVEKAPMIQRPFISELLSSLQFKAPSPN